MARDVVVLEVVSTRQGIVVQGKLTVEYNDLAKARAAVERMLKAVAEALEADYAALKPATLHLHKKG